MCVCVCVWMTDGDCEYKGINNYNNYLLLLILPSSSITSRYANSHVVNDDSVVQKCIQQ